jgi:hypothetical protein
VISGPEAQASMLSTIMRCPEAMEYMADLFEIKFNRPVISIRRERDLLTLLPVLHFMMLVRVAANADDEDVRLRALLYLIKIQCHMRI